MPSISSFKHFERDPGRSRVAPRRGSCGEMTRMTVGSRNAESASAVTLPHHHARAPASHTHTHTHANTHSEAHLILLSAQSNTKHARAREGWPEVSSLRVFEKQDQRAICDASSHVALGSHHEACVLPGPAFLAQGHTSRCLRILTDSL